MPVDREKKRARQRKYYRRNRERVSAANRKYKKKNRKKVLASGRKYYWKRKYDRMMTLLGEKRERGETGTNGVIYLFESVVPGWFKLGRTTDWKKRRNGYTGPSRIGRVFFARPCKNIEYAEHMMKCFFRNHGCEFDGGSEWFQMPP